MKVLHITTIDIGGAFKGAWRLNESLTALGIDSQIMVRTRRNGDKKVIKAFSNPVAQLSSKIKNGINRLLARGGIARDLLGTDISHNSSVEDADIVVLHWVNSFLSVIDVMKLAQMDKPIIWIMHDMWLFTGGCHYDNYCGKYVDRCGNCPLILGERDIDISRKNLEDKIHMMDKSNIFITGPSKWIVACARDSSILKRKEICYIPNTLDTSFYSPLKDRIKLRKKYQVNTEKKVILFGAADNGTSNKNKGFIYLRDALKYIPIDDYLLIIFGNANSELSLPSNLEVIRMGFIKDEKILVELYNLSDTVVAPSNQEVFGYTVCEAMACGTPAVCFPVGGLEEQVLHKENGYLAQYHDARDLAQGIMFCAEHTEELGKKARQSAEKYSYDNVGKMFSELCRRLAYG